MISFHHATPYRADPYSVRKIIPGVSDSVNQVSEGMQRAFGVVTNCVVDLRGDTNELPGVTNGALDITCMKDGYPAFMGGNGPGRQGGDGIRGGRQEGDSQRNALSERCWKGPWRSPAGRC